MWGRVSRCSALLNNGPVWLGLLLDSAETVLNVKPKLKKKRGIDKSVMRTMQ